MMTERQRRFREQYTSTVRPRYNRLGHIGVRDAAGTAERAASARRHQGGTRV